MTSKDAVLFGLRAGEQLVPMFAGDLDRDQLHHRVVPAANCAAWILGHLILTERRVLPLVGVADGDLPPLPTADFADRFGQGNDAPQREDYGGEVTGLVDSFVVHRRALVAAVADGPESAFDRPMPKPHPLAGTVGEILLFFPTHVATHLGQISTIRRSLGMPPVI